MSFMNKVKDAMSGNQDSGKRSSYDNPMDDSRNMGSSNAGNRAHGSNFNSSKGSDSYGSSGLGQDNKFDSKTSSRMGDNSNEYGSNKQDFGTHQGSDMNKRAGGLGSGSQLDSKNDRSGFNSSNRETSEMKKGKNEYGSTNTSSYNSNDRALGSQPERTMGSSDYGSTNTSSGLNSNDRNAGSIDKKGSSTFDSKTRDSNTMGTQAMRKQDETSSSNYSSANQGGYNTRSGNQDSTMSKAQDRVESEVNNRVGQSGFGGGAAAGGSSNNQAESGRRRSSGPHNSNLLNKLDPRVHSSDYKDNAASNQRGNY